MGNSNQNKSSFEQHSWRKIEESESKTILYNDMTRKSIEKHEAVIACDEGEVLEICKWRENLLTQYCIVELYEYGIKRSAMCNSYPELYVITERIHLLKDIGMISKAEAFLILRDVACGLKVLFKKFGFFNPRPNIIGINVEGRAKVWTNENLAKFLPQKDTIPVETSELAIVNNLIRILQSKTYADNNFPIDYPRNLDLVSVVNYINNVFHSLKGFEVDRVYVDRTEFQKKYNQLRQRVQQEELSRTKAMEAERRLREIEQLHQNLRTQQLELERKEQFIKMQTQQQQEEHLRQQQLQLQRLREREVQVVYANQPPPIQVIDNSRGKIMKGTTSTIQSEANYPTGNVVYYNHPYGPAMLPPQNPSRQTGNQPMFRQSTVSNQNQLQMPNQQRARQLSPQQQVLGNPPVENQRKNSMDRNSNLKKQIEMVDSMILMQEDEMSEQNKRYVQSRIIQYQV